MAWEKSHRITVGGITKEQIWTVWEDVNQWHTWDTDIEYARLEAPFEAGARFTLKPKGGPKVKLALLTVEPRRAFTDVTSFPGARMYGIHEMRERGSELELTHTVRVEGVLAFVWQKLVAEKVAAGLEEQATRMVERARTPRVNGENRG